MSSIEKKTQKTIWINDREYKFDKTLTILNAAKEVGIKIPTLCYFKDLTPTGACRICVVEVEGYPKPIPACSNAIVDGMKIHTNSPKIRTIRKTIIELLIANHPDDCNYCVMNKECELQTLAMEYGVRDRRYVGERRDNPLDITSVAIVRDPNKCILCQRCVKMCDEIQSVHAIDFTKRGFQTIVASAFNKTIEESNCVTCGQCIRVCPTGALKEKSALAEVFGAINDPNLIVTAQVAPSISVSIGEEFGLPPGTDMTGKLVKGLRLLGFDYVFDTVLGADLTVMEEANELIKRIKDKKTLPLISTCCPAWIKFMEFEYPSIIPNMSTCKSPQQMLAAIIKEYWAPLKGISPKKVFQVSIMPCTAKKFEAERPEFVLEGVKTTDAVLTTRELVRMFRVAGIDLSKLSEDQYDDPLGSSTGAGKIFGTAGGVMEAALRTTYWMINKKNLENMEFHDIRGFKGIKKTKVELTPEIKVNCVAVNGLRNARTICEEVLSGNPNKYHFIEVMACVGGCINGGGQPRHLENNPLESRAECLFELDRKYPIRFSHENPSVNKLYQEFLKEFGSEKAHHLLHTKYYPRKEEVE